MLRSHHAGPFHRCRVRRHHHARPSRGVPRAGCASACALRSSARSRASRAPRSTPRATASSISISRRSRRPRRARSARRSCASCPRTSRSAAMPSARSSCGCRRSPRSPQQGDLDPAAPPRAHHRALGRAAARRDERARRHPQRRRRAGADRARDRVAAGRPAVLRRRLPRARAARSSPPTRHAFEALEVFYRSTERVAGARSICSAAAPCRSRATRSAPSCSARWRSSTTASSAIDGAALDAYREADRLEPGISPTCSKALARLSLEVGVPEDEALSRRRAVRQRDRRSQGAREGARHAPPSSRSCRTGTRRSSCYEQARDADPDLAERRRRSRDAAPRQGPAVRSDHAARQRGRAQQDRARRAGSSMRPTSASRSATPTGRSSSIATRAPPIRGNMQGRRRARRARLGRRRSSVELAPILDQLCRTTDDPSRLRGYLIQRSKVARQVGDMTARAQPARARGRDRSRGRRAAPRARRHAVRGAAVGEGAAADGRPARRRGSAAARRRRRAALPGRALARRSSATSRPRQKHVDIALVLQPDHRAALLLRTELGQADPHQHVADQLALANTAPPEERATRFAAIGDRYIELGDRAAAREMYREAIVAPPRRSPAAHEVPRARRRRRRLELQPRRRRSKLIDTEKDPKVRARYRHLAGMIARDELDDHERARPSCSRRRSTTTRSRSPPPTSSSRCSITSDDRTALADVLLQAASSRCASNEGRPGERLRLWDHLGELLHRARPTTTTRSSRSRSRSSLDPDNLDRRKRLADLYADRHASTTPRRSRSTRRSCATNKRHLESYKALRALYERTRQPERAKAVPGRARRARRERVDKIGELFDGRRRRPRRTTATAARAHERGLARAGELDVDLQLSALFAVVAPPFAVERARMRPPLAVPRKEHELPRTCRRCSRASLACSITPAPAGLLRERPGRAVQDGDAPARRRARAGARCSASR